MVLFAKKTGLDAVDLALFGGEEYELVVTVKPDLWGKAIREVEEVGGTLVQIGIATSDNGVVLETDGKKREIAAKGYEHFKSRV